MKTFFFFDLHQNDIFPDLADTVPGNDIFAFSSPEAAEFSRSRYDQSRDLPIFLVKFQVDRTAKTLTGAGIYDFFLFQLTQTHKHTVFSKIYAENKANMYCLLLTLHEKIQYN